MDFRSKSKTITESNDGVQLPDVFDNNIPTAPGLCPGAQSTGDDPIDRFASEIRQEWRKSVQSILKVAESCAKADHELDVLQKSRLYKRLPFDRTAFSKLAAIGKRPALLNERIQKSFPANWTTIYLLRKLTEEEIEQAIRDRALTPSSRRNEISAWLSEHSSHRKDDHRRAAANDAHHENFLRDLKKAFQSSTELIAIWGRCPEAVRIRFARSLVRSGR